MSRLSQPMTAVSFYRRNVASSWPFYAWGVMAMLLTSTTEVFVPKFVQWTIDLLSTGSVAAAPSLFQAETALASLHLLVIGFACLICLGVLGRVGWRQLLARQTHVAGRNMKTQMWGVLRWLPLHWFHRYPLGDLMNRATGDWNASRYIHGFTWVLTLDVIFFTTLATVSMFWIDPEMALYCVAVFPFLPRLISKYAKREHEQHRWAQEGLSSLSDLISQCLATVRLQRATNTEQRWRSQLDEQAEDYAGRRFEVVKTGLKIFPIGAVPTLIAYAVLLIWGVQKIQAGTMTVGEFAAMQSYVLMLQIPLFELGDCIAEWQRGFASLGRLTEVYGLAGHADQLRQRQAQPDARAHDLVVIDNFSYQYTDGGPKVLSRVSFKLAAGERVGIYGPIGSGKSTLINLMAGLIDHRSDQILIGNCAVDTVDRAWFAQHVALVPQRPFLFAGSLRHNLELGESFPVDELWQVLEAVELDEFVRELPEQLDTWIGEWGVNLSGGQKQRLALARALLRKRQLLLLDDCLSAVDAVTEERILGKLEPYLADAAVVWVAHRQSTLALCDRLYELDAGQLRVQEVVP